MKIMIDKSSPTDWIRATNSNVSTVYKSNYSENQIELAKDQGEGFITHHDYDHTIELFVLQAHLKKSLELHFCDPKKEHLYLSFCIEGEIEHFLEHQFLYELQRSQGAIAAPVSNKQQIIKYNANKKVLSSLIRIHRQKYLEKLGCTIHDLPENFKPLFSQTKRPVVYSTNSNFDCISCVYDIIGNADTGSYWMAFFEVDLIGERVILILLIL